MLNQEGNPLLPNEILWRKKEAFSDGVSKHSRSLYEIIQEHTDELFNENERIEFEYIKNSPEIYQVVARRKFNINYLLPQTSEQCYYRKIFETHYGGCGSVVPYFWMPKYVNAKDASARTLAIYNEE